MKNSVVFIISLIVFCVTGVLVATIYRNRCPKIRTEVEVVTDTIFINKVDTIFIDKPIVVSKKIIDTIVVENEKIVVFPIEQKHYAKEGVYDAWVSGYHAKLDSIKTYNQTEYKTINNTKTITTEIKKIGIYPYVGVINHNDLWGSRVGLNLTTKGKFSFGGEVGTLNNKLFWGANIGYKIN